MKQHAGGLMVVAAIAASAACEPAEQQPGFALDWSLAYAGGGATSCEAAGAAAVVLTARRVDDGRTFDSGFRCAAAGGVSRALPPGEYRVAVRLEDERGQVLDQLDLPEPVAVQEGELTPLGDVPFDIAAFFVAWRIEASASGARVPISCFDAGADEVWMLVTSSDSTTAQYEFPCPSHEGRTEAIPPGTYRVGLRLVTIGGALIADIPAASVTVGRDAPGDLGLAVFAVPWPLPPVF